MEAVDLPQDMETSPLGEVKQLDTFQVVSWVGEGGMGGGQCIHCGMNVRKGACVPSERARAQGWKITLSVRVPAPPPRPPRTQYTPSALVTSLDCLWATGSHGSMAQPLHTVNP